MRKKKKRKLTKNFKILLVTIIIITGFIYFNKTEKEEILIKAENLKSKTTEEAHIIDNIKTYKQFPEYPTGCESVSLHILLDHYGIKVDVEEIIEKLPKGNIPYEEDGELYGANPEEKFIGSPYNEYSFGVYEKPIKTLANKFKKGAKSEKGISIDKVKNILKSENPLIVWTRIEETLTKIEYVDSWKSEEDGKTIQWPKGEHAVVLYGYDKDYYYISNPYNGEKYPIKKEIFEHNFKALGSRIVYYE